MSSSDLTYLQAGIESTRGTAVAATRRLYPSRITVPELKPFTEPVSQARQNFEAVHDEVKHGEIVDGWKFEFDQLNFQTLPWWLGLAAKGGVSPSGAGPYTYTFDSASTSDDLDTATIEVVDDVEAWEVPFSMAKSAEISFELGSEPKAVKGSYELMGKTLTSGITATGALSELDLTGSYMSAQNMALYIDNAAGGIGSTEVATLEGGSISWDNKLVPRFYGNDSGKYGSVKRANRMLEISLTVDFDAAMLALYTGKLATNTIQYVSLVNTGAVNDAFTINLATHFHAIPFDDDGPTRRLRLVGRAKYDATLGYAWQMIVVNAISAMA